jgi:hypothetical protein
MFRRCWTKLHSLYISTWAVLVLVLFVGLIVNCCGDISPTAALHCHHGADMLCTEYGVPWIFGYEYAKIQRVPVPVVSNFQPGVNTFCNLGETPGFFDFIGELTDLHWLVLVGNLLFWVLLSILMAWAWQYRRSHRNRFWQFTLLDLMGTVTALALLIAYGQSLYREKAFLEQENLLLGQHVYDTYWDGLTKLGIPEHYLPRWLISVSFEYLYVDALTDLKRDLALLNQYCHTLQEYNIRTACSIQDLQPILPELNQFFKQQQQLVSVQLYHEKYEQDSLPLNLKQDLPALFKLRQLTNLLLINNVLTAQDFQQLLRDTSLFNMQVFSMDSYVSYVEYLAACDKTGKPTQGLNCLGVDFRRIDPTLQQSEIDLPQLDELRVILPLEHADPLPLLTTWRFPKLEILEIEASIPIKNDNLPEDTTINKMHHLSTILPAIVSKAKECPQLKHITLKDFYVDASALQQLAQLNPQITIRLDDIHFADEIDPVIGDEQKLLELLQQIRSKVEITLWNSDSQAALNRLFKAKPIPGVEVLPGYGGGNSGAFF